MTKASTGSVDPLDLAPLRAKYGSFTVEHYAIEMDRTSLEYHRKQSKRRRGEILLVLSRPGGDVLLHTKFEYPAGVYRLPTGGIDHGEPVAEAWHRELWEETQLRSTSERLLGVLSYEFVGDGPSVSFVSFVFEQDGVTQEPQPLDESEGISEFRWVPRVSLKEVAENLRSLDRIDQQTGDWGRFRAVAHDFVLQAK